MNILFFEPSDLEHGSFTRENGEFRYRITKDHCLIIEGSGILEQDIESTHGNAGEGWDSGYDIEETDWPWSDYSEQITKIVIKKGITAIGHNAFSGYSNVTAIELPETLERIGQSAFYGTGISQIQIPDSVNYIGMLAFAGTKLPRSAREFIVDRWLIYCSVPSCKEFRISPEIRGIAQLALGSSEIEALYIPGTIKHIPSQEMTHIKRVYLGFGCPPVSGSTFVGEPWREKPEIICVSSVLPW